MNKRHKVFISFHHKDEQYKEKFEQLFGDVSDVLISKSVQDGDIDDGNIKTDTIRQKIRDEYLADSTVTIVLIGAETWKRKHVDWEISSSIRSTKNNPRSGLIGIILPSYPRPSPDKYGIYTIPPRLHSNLACEYARIFSWTNNPDNIQRWVHQAFLRKDQLNPNNSYALFTNNRSGAKWQ